MSSGQRIPVTAKVVVQPDTLFVSISQSGETADTALAALRNAKEFTSGVATSCLAICGVISSLVRESI